MVFWPSRLLSLGLLVLLSSLIWFWNRLSAFPPLTNLVNPDRPDLIAEEVHALRFDKEGRPKFILAASAMRHLPKDDTILFDAPMLMLDQIGKPKLFIRAQQARTIHRASDIWLYDQVTLRRESNGEQDELQIWTQNVWVKPNLGQAVSSAPVTATMGPYRISAVGFVADQEKQTLNLTSNVRITYVPQDRAHGPRIAR